MRPAPASPAALIAVGTELISHGRPDTNGATLARILSSTGIPTAARILVADEQEEIAAALAMAERRYRLVIVTGGLGPTAADVTLEAAGRAFGLSLDTDLPQGAEALFNAAGTAPGLLLRRPGGGLIVLLPGVPHEMERMMREEVLPRLEGFSRNSLVSRALKVSGLSELDVQSRILDLFHTEEGPGAPQLTLLASPGEISVIVRGEDAEVLERIVEAAQARLGEHVFAQDLDTGLEAAVGRLFSTRGLKLAVAESCTGGLLGSLITKVPGCSGWFLQGWVAYSDESKTAMLGIDPHLIREHGAVSQEVAQEMARTAQRLSGADLAVSVTGIAGPEGGSPAKPVGLVYLSVATPRQCRTTRHLFAGDRETIRLFAARTALDRMRLEAPAPG